MLLPSIFGDRFFDNDFVDFPTFKSRTENALMKSDVKDAGDHFELHMDLPGFQKENVKIQLREGVLNIEATTTTSNDEKDEEGTYIRKERFQGTCTRSFYVGEDIKQEDIKAKFDNGVLSITVPKEAPKQKMPENTYIAIEG